MRSARTRRASRVQPHAAPDGRGTVVRVYTNGYGFILDTANTERYFHASNCLTVFDAIAPGDEVKFVPGVGPKGPVAYRVEVMEEEAAR